MLFVDYGRKKIFPIIFRLVSPVRSQAFAPSVLVASWYSNNTPSENRRAVVAAVNGICLSFTAPVASDNPP
jgi:hypothetical protein